jgi:penicillin-binding protein 2
VAHVLGYTGKLSPQQYRTARGRYQLNDTVGKAGLELQYEDLLRGVPGWREVEVDASGKERKVYSSQTSLPGSNLTLTVDAGLQQTAFKSLQRAVKNSTGNRYGGSVVVLDARSAEVLALVSYPSFDPNYFTVQRDTGKVKGLLADEKKPLFNRALAGEYSPGSTIKPFIGAAALQEGLITPQTTVTSTGGVKAGNQFFADWKAGGHGLVNIYRAIAESVNTFFYIIGGGTDDRRGLGITTLVRYFTKFGFGSATGLDLSGEALGFVPTPLWKQATENDRWYRGDTYNVSIGQGKLVVTPLQLAAAYVSLVNQGELLWPHLVREVGYPSGAKSPVASRQLANVGISDEVRAVIKSAMRQTVLSGSARSLGDLPVAGKTGTAQTGSKTATHAWFAGYMPADKPAIVVVVMVEHGGEGSSVAVPVARDIFSWYLQNRRSALGL